MNKVVLFSEFKSKSPRENPVLFSVSRKLVEPLFGTLSSGLRQIHADMLAEECFPENRWLRSTRVYRQRFCKLTREFSDLSPEELCARLNEHPDILKLKRLPSFERFYPITPEFISDLENCISKIIEYNPYGGGFLGIGAYGIPTPEIAKAIADICGTKRQYEKFERWCFEYQYGETAGRKP